MGLGDYSLEIFGDSDPCPQTKYTPHTSLRPSDIDLTNRHNDEKRSLEAELAEEKRRHAELLAETERLRSQHGGHVARRIE